MVVYLPRSAWTTVPKPDTLAPLLRDQVDGDAQHWPGGTVDFGGKTQEQIARYLEGIRRYHTGVKGWQDIAYLQAVDPAGRMWDLRGMEHRSAANGDTGPNSRFGATLWLVGPNERPTDAQVTAYQTWRRDRWLQRYPDAVLVKRHSDVRPESTACPGPYVGALVTSGTLAQPPEDDMATAAEIAEQILRTEKVEGGKDQADVSLSAAVGQLITKVNRIEAKVGGSLSDADVDRIAAKVTPAVVVAVVDAIGAGLTKEVLDTMAARLRA